MQCPSCRFENMPGSGACARCGAALAVGNVDVIPPRASARERRVPVELRAAVYRARSAATVLQRRLRGFLPLRSRAAGRYDATSFAPTGLVASGGYGGEAPQELDLKAADWFRLVVPGWVQVRYGERTRGNWLLGVTAGLLLAALLLAGSSWGAMALGALFSWHLLATVDAVCRRFATMGDRVRLTLWTAFLLGAIVYLPIIWGVGQFAKPLTVQHPTRYFHSGDVVWYRPGVMPHIGDLVLYEVPPRAVAGRQGVYAANLRIEGQRINRLVAVAGQRLGWQDSQLLIDGEPSPWQPRSWTMSDEFVVPANHVYILPEDLVPAQFQAIGATASSLGIVPVASVHGTVSYRTYPIHRFQRF